MSLPAAHITSVTAHGGTVVMGSPTTLIGGMPASRMGDTHVCPMLTVLVPHVGGPIVLGAFNVLVSGPPAARMTDLCVCVGPPSMVLLGSFTTLIGMAGAFSGGLGGFLSLALGGVLAGLRNAAGVYPRAVLQKDGSYLTEYSENIRVAGTPEQQARNVQQLNAIRQGPGGQAFLDSLGSPGNPVTVNVIGDPARAAALHPGQQSYQNCAVQSSQQIIRQATGNNYTEGQMENIANSPSASGYTRTGGTPAGGEATILQNGGVPAHMEPGTTANVDRALSNNQGVVSGHDAGRLWNDPSYAGSGHDVVTTGAIQDSNGNTLGYVVNDTGANQAARTVPAADYQRSMDGGPIAVTNNPVW